MKIAVLTTDSREHFRDYSNPRPYFGTAPEALLQGFAMLPDVEVHVISCLRRSIQSPEKIADNIFYHGLHVPKLGWMRTLYRGCIRTVRERLKHIRPDIVHGQGTERDCALNAVRSGFPNVLTIHGNMRLIARLEGAGPFSYGWLAARLESFVLPRTDGVVCITNYTRDAVAPLSKRTWLLPNGVDESFFDVNSRPDPTQPATILCVGAVCPRKNQNAFIRALDPLAAQMKLRVIFLGQAAEGEPYLNEFMGLVSARPWCSYVGFADRGKLRTQFQTASMLALPSLEDNCPMVVLEAMAAGVPVLAAKVGGVPDLVEDGATGLFCDPLDPGSMSSGVGKLLRDPALGGRLAMEAKRRALERFHPRVIARRHVEIYGEVLETRRLQR